MAKLEAWSAGRNSDKWVGLGSEYVEEPEFPGGSSAKPRPQMERTRTDHRGGDFPIAQTGFGERCQSTLR